MATWSRVGRVAAEVAIIVSVVLVVLFAQDTFGDSVLSEGEYRWDHLLQTNGTNTTVAGTPAPSPPGTQTVTFRYDLPGVTVIVEVTFRNGVANSLMITVVQVTITQIITPIPAALAGAKMEVQSAKFGPQQTPGSRVIFTIAGLTAAQAAAAQNTLNANCAANLASLGVNCASLATSTSTVPVAPPASDDDTSGLIGGLVGGIGGCCCLVALGAVFLVLLKKKKQQQHHQEQELGYAGAGSIAGPGPYPPPPTPLGNPQTFIPGPGAVPFQDPTFGPKPFPPAPNGPYPAF